MIGKIRQYSIPLIAGVIVALIWANVNYDSYETVVFTPVIGEHINLSWLINDIFMCFFFATAAVELVNSLSKGGSLNPISKAVTPIMATFGGVLVPIALFIILNAVMGSPDFANGWGICTATDIALAWLGARILFGENHPAVSFLLLLAVSDDAIGLVIIAIFYPDPNAPVDPKWLVLVAGGMIVAFIMRKLKVSVSWPYILVAGALSWFGMHNAHLHPALALVFIVPFMQSTGITVQRAGIHSSEDAAGSSALQKFEENAGPFVDFGLFFFGLTNAGVVFSSMSNLTVIILVALVLGKTIGISLFTAVALLFKAKLPTGMNFKDVVEAGAIGGMGLTVALFITESAFTDLSLQGAAKMGALFSVIVFVYAVVARKFRKKHNKL